MKQESWFGYGSIENLKEIITRYGFGRVFVVCGKSSFDRSGAREKIAGILGEDGFVRFSEFEKNPELKAVEKGIEAFKRQNPDFVIGVGGGTAIDTAKLINILACQEYSPFSYLVKEKKIERMGKPLLAIPTTAGSGSEATHFAVVYANEKKYSLAHASILPQFAIVDPSLTSTMPPRLTAVTGLDALCQGIESYWATGSTDESKAYAEKAIALCLSYLKKVVLLPDEISREKMALAASLAGKAINITKTTGPHAFSYYLTSRFHISHGYAAALFLGNFFVFNSGVSNNDACDKRGAGYVRSTMNRLCEIFEAENPLSVREKIRSLMTEIGLVPDIKQTGFNPEKHLEEFVAGIDADRLENNPRKVGWDSIRAIILG